MCRVHVQVWIIHGAEVARILGFVLLNIGLVDPAKRIHEHLVESWRDVSHKRHEEEGYLKNRVFKEVETIGHSIIPLSMIHIHDKG